MCNFNKLFKLEFTISVVFLLLQACNTEKSTETSDSSTTNKSEMNSTLEAVSPNVNSVLNLILQASDGPRLDKLGQSLGSIKKSETLVPSDSASNFYAYTQYFNNSEDEFVDIQYFHDGEKVKGLVFDVFLNKETDVNLLMGELALNFSEKYGKMKKNENEQIWKLKNDQELKLKDVSVKLAPGLQISLAKNGENLEVE